MCTCMHEMGLTVVDPQGWLLKKTKRTDRWLQRYVTLRACFLTVSHSPDRQGSMSKVYQVLSDCVQLLAVS
jgi:hypothetical protein